MKKLMILVTLVILVAFGATSFAAHVAIANNNEIAKMKAELVILEDATPEVVIDGDNLNFLIGLDREEAEGYGLYDGEVVYIDHQNAFSFTAILHFDNNDLLVYDSLLSLESDIRSVKGSIHTTYLAIAAAIMLIGETLVMHFIGNAVAK